MWRPYSAAPRYRELITPSRTSIVDLANGEEVAWRTHEDEDIETFAREGWGSPDQPMKREEIILGWESDDATTLDGEPIELGEGGRTDLLDRSAGWSEVRFERPADSSDGRWRISERTGSSGWLLDPEGERQIVELVDGGVNQVAFSPDRGDGSEWVALATTGGLALWRLGPVEALVAETCARAPRNLEADEWPLDGPPPVTCPDR